jgi:hypothetical protein
MNALSTGAQSFAGATIRRSTANRLRRSMTTNVTLMRRVTWQRIGLTIVVAAAFALWSAFGNWMRARFGHAPRPIGLAAFFVHDGWGWLHGLRTNLPMFFLQMVVVSIAEGIPVAGAFAYSCSWVPSCLARQRAASS